MAEWEGAKEALTLVNDHRALFRQKWVYQWQWFISLNFYAGNQWIQWVPSLQRVELMPEDPDKPRVTENKIQSLVRQAVGKIQRQKLKQICPPSAFGEDEVDKAKVRTQLLEHLWRTTKGDWNLNVALFWAALTGSGFLRYWWDPDAGPQKKGKPLGDIAVTPVSPFSIVVPPNCLTLEEMPWIMEVTTRPVSWVKETHGMDVNADASVNAFDQFDARVLDFTSGGAFINTQPDVSTKDKDGKSVDGGACNYVMYWERPTQAHQNGQYIVVAGGKVVYPTNAEEAEAGITVHSPSGDLPYNRLSWFHTGFRFWEMGMVELLVSLQRERNLLASMILDGIKHTVRASVMAPKGSVKKDSWNAEAGAVLEYEFTGGGKPEPLQTTPVHPEVFQRISMIDQDMADIAGIHYRPSVNMRAAAAFALQQESDNATSEPITQNVEAFLIRDGQLKLRLAKANYNKGRTIRVAGSAMQWEVIEFDRDKLGDSDEVEIQTGGQLAQDRIQRMDQVIKLLAAKDAKGEPLIDSYEARRLLDLENTENLDSGVRADMNRARFENTRLEKGQQVPVNRFDNHQVHMREHYLRMKRLDFDELTVEQQQAFMAHTLAHEQAIMGAAMAQRGPAPPGPQMQQPMPGMQPGAPPQPPQAPPVVQAQPGSTMPPGLQAGLTHVANVVSQANQ